MDPVIQYTEYMVCYCKIDAQEQRIKIFICYKHSYANVAYSINFEDFLFFKYILYGNKVNLNHTHTCQVSKNIFEINYFSTE